MSHRKQRRKSTFRFIPAVILVMVFLLIFLHFRKNSTPTIESGTSVDFPSVYQGEIKGVLFDMELEVPNDFQQSDLRESTAHQLLPDVEAADQFFSEGRITTSETKESVIDHRFAELPILSKRYEDGAYIYISNMLVYTNGNTDKINNSFRIQKTDLYNADRYSVEEDLAFSGREDAFQKIKEALGACSLESSGLDYISYALDHQTMSEEYKETDKSGIDIETGDMLWTEDDDCYAFFIEQNYQGLPVYFGLQDFPDDEIGSRPIQAFVNSEGLQYLFLQSAYRFDEGGKQFQLTEIENIADAVAEKYGSILNGYSYTVLRAKLYQMPLWEKENDYDIKPVWLIETEESGIDSESGMEMRHSLYSLFDACTGKEIVW